jgi:hypothetical protein
MEGGFEKDILGFKTTRSPRLTNRDIPPKSFILFVVACTGSPMAVAKSGKGGGEITSACKECIKEGLRERAVPILRVLVRKSLRVYSRLGRWSFSIVNILQNQR